MLFKPFYSVIIRTHNDIFPVWQNLKGLTGKCSNVPDIKTDKSLCRDLPGSLYSSHWILPGRILKYYGEGLGMTYKDDVCVAQCLQELLVGEKRLLWAKVFTGSTAPAVIFHIPLEAGQSYWKTLQHKNEHPVTQTCVVLCHLLNLRSRVLAAKKPCSPSTLLWYSIQECRVVETKGSVSFSEHHKSPVLSPFLPDPEVFSDAKVPSSTTWSLAVMETSHWRGPNTWVFRRYCSPVTALPQNQFN